MSFADIALSIQMIGALTRTAGTECAMVKAKSGPHFIMLRHILPNPGR